MQIYLENLANTCVSPISLGHPGTLPKPNKKVIEYAIKLGLAFNCKINFENQYARKNYYYTDLPKGYQITQDKTPICTGGYVEMIDKDGKSKKINLTRIHMEEDAGKSIHDLDPFNSLIDLNRAGVPLLEIVSEPELRSSKEAYEYLQEVRKSLDILKYVMETWRKVVLRCDANISVRKKGSKIFNSRVEIKNLNSFSNVQKAIETERNRQVTAYENGESIEQETRNYNAKKNNSTIVLRKKEDAHDYRYFPEPDIQPIMISDEMIRELKKTMPSLPNELFKKYTNNYKLSIYDSKNLTENKNLSLFFQSVIKFTKQYKIAANIIMGVIKGYLNENSKNISDLELKPIFIAELSDMIHNNEINNSIASQKIFPEMLKDFEKISKRNC